MFKDGKVIYCIDYILFILHSKNKMFCKNLNMTNPKFVESR